MRHVYIIGSAVLVLGAAGLLASMPESVTIAPKHGDTSSTTAVASTTSIVLPSIPEAPQPSFAASTTPSASTTQPIIADLKNYGDIGPQPQLADPPAIIKGIYLTAWSAGSPNKIQSVINMIKKTELNAVVIDIKDYSGYVSYEMNVPEVIASGAEDQIRIARPNSLIKELHDNGIYVIGRITDFQDPILAKAHPEWALHNKATGGVWTDKNGLAWMDPAAKPVWDYLASIARDAFDRGFDEVQFDYIRFASDGVLGNISYPYWDAKTPRATVIANYFKFLRSEFPNQKISADLFGLATVNRDDLGIGQVIQNAFKYFDYVSPMVYPSHYASGFLGYAQPAKYPYEVIAYSMEQAIAKLKAMGNTNSTIASAPADPSSTATSSPATTTATSAPTAPSSPYNLGYIPPTKLRPWLQDFEINGVPYTASMIRAEKQAVYDTLNTPTSSQYYDGWLIWDAANVYTMNALDPK